MNNESTGSIARFHAIVAVCLAVFSIGYFIIGRWTGENVALNVAANLLLTFAVVGGIVLAFVRKNAEGNRER